MDETPYARLWQQARAENSMAVIRLQRVDEQNVQNKDGKFQKFEQVLAVAKDWEDMFRDKKLCDFTIHAGDLQIQVHKLVLIARSPVFAAMLEPHTEESQNNCVHLEDIESDVLNEMLFYIYSGRSPNLKEMATDLLGAADRFALIGLKDMAEQYLRTNLSIETVCRVLIVAEMHGARELKESAIQFVAHNAAQVVKTESWRQLITSRPTLVTEVVLAMSALIPKQMTPMMALGKRVRNWQE